MHFLITFIKHSVFWKNTFSLCTFWKLNFFKKPNLKKLNQTHLYSYCNSAIWSTSYVSNAYGDRYCPGMVIIILFHCFITISLYFVLFCCFGFFFLVLCVTAPAWLSSFFFIALLPFHIISCCFVFFFFGALFIYSLCCLRNL